jgi:hypothetical protein
MPNAVCCANNFTCCPQGTVCQDSGSSWSVVTTCVDPNTKQPKAQGLQTCKVGPTKPFDDSKRHCLVMGDSVSIGYTPPVAKLLSDVCDVLHTPDDDRDGGACETAYGFQCLDYFLSSSSGHALKLDLIYFNYGLHNLVVPPGAVTPGQSGWTTEYLPYLVNITQRLVAMKTKLIFGLTSPWLCDVNTDNIIQQLNADAAKLMATYGIPTVDLHKAITDKCGVAPQQECFGQQGCWCPHCGAGYDWLANSTVAPAIRAVLNS